jgi:hypothetical protein
MVRDQKKSVPMEKERLRKKIKNIEEREKNV